ncbi:hypothetical protein LCGC14_2788340, partial [marine sediment metagenome]
MNRLERAKRRLFGIPELAKRPMERRVDCHGCPRRILLYYNPAGMCRK